MFFWISSQQYRNVCGGGGDDLAQFHELRQFWLRMWRSSRRTAPWLGEERTLNLK